MRSAFLVGPFFILTLLAATTTGARSAILPRHVIASPYATQLPELTPPEYQPLAIVIVVCPDGPLFTEIIEIPSDDDPTLDFTLEEEFFPDERERGVYYVLIAEPEASAGRLQVPAVQSQESPESEDRMHQQKVTAQPASTDQVSTRRVPTLEGSASVSGTVLDSRGAVIQGAQVSLTLTDGSRLQTVKSDANGEFTFPRFGPVLIAWRWMLLDLRHSGLKSLSLWQSKSTRFRTSRSRLQVQRHRLLSIRSN